jgi:DNA-binding MarR family transcriptional regulator
MIDRVLPRTLLALGRAFEKRALAALHADGHLPLRPSHFPVFSFIGLGTVRVSELADRAQQTQQGMGKTLRELEQMGYIERAVDSQDRRAKAIKLTKNGKKVADLIARSFTAIRAEQAAQLGQDDYAKFVDLLDQLVAVTALETPAPYWR